MRVVGFVCLFLAVAATTGGADPLDKPAFTATPAELLAAGAGVTSADHDVVVLRDDTALTYDARGRVSRRYHVVFKVLTQAGVDDWGTLSIGWSPFYQERPTLRARVVAPDATVAELDPALVHEAPTVSESATIFSDRRALSAPLPRLVVGAVVDEEFTLSDREPLLPAGQVDWTAVRRRVPIQRAVITVAAPSKPALTVVTRGPALPRPAVRTAGGVTTTTWSLRALPPADESAAGAPTDWSANPEIGVTTGASWAAVADGYRALVDPKLAQAAAVPPDLLGPTPRATVERIVAWVHGRIRYTGIELSDSAIVPFAPTETLARGFGDCKDQAALVVSLLRAAKIPADLALLSTGPGLDVDPRLPGLGDFDHAIVRARVDGKDLWIDATEPLLPVGQLPVRDQGRLALVIAPGARALTLTPVGAPLDNLVREERSYHFGESGRATITEVNTLNGFWQGDARGYYADTARDDLTTNLRKYVASEYDGELVSFSTSAPRDLATPLGLTVEVRETAQAGTQRDLVWVWLSPDAVFDDLPDTITSKDADIARRIDARTVDYLWTWPHVYEVVNRLELPPGFTAPPPTPPETRPLGTMTLTTTRALAAGVLTITYRLDTGPRRITAAQLRATRDAVRAVYDEGAQRVSVPLAAAQLATAGKIRAAIDEYQRLIALHPTHALHHSQLALLLETVGMYDAARREARLATTVEPGAADGWSVLGYLLGRDELGRYLTPRADRAGAEAAYRKALALNPRHQGAKAELAALLATGPDGDPSPRAADHRTAAAMYRELAAVVQDGSYDDRLINELALAGDATGLEAFARGLTDGDRRRDALVLATALRDPAAAVRQAAALGGNEVDALYQRVSERLLHLRRYDALRTVAAARASSDPQWRGMLDRLRAVDRAALPPAAPETAELLMMARVLFGPLPSPPWSPLVDRALGLERIAAQASAKLGDYSRAVMLDLMAALAPPTTTGDARHGWRTELTFGTQRLSIYTLPRKGRATLIGGPQLLGPLGVEIVAAASRGALDEARAMITLLADDPLPAQVAAIGAFVVRQRATLAKADRARLTAIGAVIAGAAGQGTAAALRGCGGLTSLADRHACDQAAAELALRTGDAALLEPVQRGLAAAASDDDLARFALALARLGKPGDAIAALEPALDVRPDALPLRRARLLVALAIGWTEGASWAALVATAPDVTSTILNEIAWARLYHDPTPATARELIERALPLAQGSRTGLLNTYALALAADGEPYTAWQQLRTAMADLDEPRLDDRLVLARIAEGFGLRDDALAMYRAIVKTPAQFEGVGMPTARDFAQQRLKALGAAP